MTLLVKNAKEYCLELLLQSRCSSLPFHNVDHTIEVYENVLRIGMYENVSVDQLEPILLAALFHDTGNSTLFAGHEEHSAINAINFLLAQKIAYSKIDIVVDCIRVTRLPQKPSTILEKIICDADLCHLGSNTYFLKNHLLRKEWSEFLNTEYTDTKWNLMNIEFLQGHRFHTTYGHEILNIIKHENIRQLKNQYENSLKE